MTAKQELEKLGKKIVSEIEKGKNPAIDLPVRALSNMLLTRRHAQSEWAMQNQ